jgi:hypothetical protein
MRRLIHKLERNVSAEIFVVCRDFLAPKHIDPKFLDPKHVFKDLAASTASGTDKGSSAQNIQANVFQPEKKRRKRDGYDDGDYTLFKAVPVADFVRSPDPIMVLGTVNKMTFVTEEEKEYVNICVQLRRIYISLGGMRWISPQATSKQIATITKSWERVISRPCSNGDLLFGRRYVEMLPLLLSFNTMGLVGARQQNEGHGGCDRDG